MALDLPPVNAPADVVAAMATVIDAVAAGEISLEEAKDAASLLAAQREAIETCDLAARVAALEAGNETVG